MYVLRLYLCRIVLVEHTVHISLFESDIVFRCIDPVLVSAINMIFKPPFFTIYSRKTGLK